MADATQDTIRLSTNNGLTGYRIVKFEVIAKSPFNATQESVLKIYKYKQDAIDGIIDFNDGTLLAIGVFKQHDSTSYMAWDSVIFDNEIFNQDIYITNYDAATGESMNYYLELEQVKLDVNEAAVATLKDMRGTN